MKPEERAENLSAFIGEKYGTVFHQFEIEEISKSIRQAILEEREACAKVADNLAERLIKKYNPRQDSMIMTAVNIAQEIRDRSNETI